MRNISGNCHWVFPVVMGHVRMTDWGRKSSASSSLIPGFSRPSAHPLLHLRDEVVRSRTVPLASPHSDIWMTILLNWNRDWTKWTDVNILRMIDHLVLFRKDVTSVRCGWWVVTGHIWRFKFNSLIPIQGKWPVTRWSLATAKMLFMEFRGWTCASHSELAMTHLQERDRGSVTPRLRAPFPRFLLVVGRWARIPHH